MVRDGDRSASEVGEESKGGNRAVEDGSVEFAKDIGTTSVSGEDYKRAEVARSHFSVEGLFDGGITK